MRHSCSVLLLLYVHAGLRPCGARLQMAGSHGLLHVSYVVAASHVWPVAPEAQVPVIDLVWGALCRLLDVRVCRAAH